MLAGEEVQERKIEKYIGNLVNPIFEKAIIDENKKNNQSLESWI